MGSLESDSGLGVEPVSECVRRNRHVLFCCTQAGNNDYSWMYVHNFSRYGTIIILKRGGHSIHTSSNKTYSQSGCFQDPLSHPTNKILPNILPLAPLPNSLPLYNVHLHTTTCSECFLRSTNNRPLTLFSLQTEISLSLSRTFSPEDFTSHNS